MRIAFFMTTTLQYGGGFEKYLIRTAEMLNSVENFQIDIITMDKNYSNKIKKLLRFYYFKEIHLNDDRITYKEIEEEFLTGKYYQCSSILELKMKLNQYDLIYSKNEVLEAFILKFLIGYNKIPSIIFSCGTPLYYPYTKNITDKIHNLLYTTFLYRWLTSGVKSFHVKNSTDEKIVHKLFPQKTVTKIKIPNYIPEETDAIIDKKINNLDVSKFNITWVGRLTEQKGVTRLVSLINKIDKKDFKNQINWNIAGDGEMIEVIKNTCNLHKNVFFFNQLSLGNVFHLLRKSNLFISTSLWESFGQNVLEAQTVGLPVFSYDIPGPNEIIIQNETGLLLNSEEDFVLEIERILKDNKFNKEKIISITERRFGREEFIEKMKLLFL